MSKPLLIKVPGTFEARVYARDEASAREKLQRALFDEEIVLDGAYFNNDSDVLDVTVVVEWGDNEPAIDHDLEASIKRVGEYEG